MIGGIDKAGGKKVEKYKVTFNLSPVEATLVVKDLQGEIIQPTEENNVYELEAGIYTYTATAEEYISKEDIRLEIYQETIVEVQLDKSIYFKGFGNLTDEELEKMLNAHYNGEIDVSDYWAVGDTRILNIKHSTIHLSRECQAAAAQNIAMVILGFNHDDLVEPIGTRTKAAVTIQTRECLNNDADNDAVKAYQNVSSSAVRDTTSLQTNTLWSYQYFTLASCADYIYWLPDYMQKLIKKVNKICYRPKIGSNEVVSFDGFLVSQKEIFGDEYSTSPEEGVQYDYFKIKSNRIKYTNNNGQPNLNKPNYWWIRTLMSKRVGSINTNGIRDSSSSQSDNLMYALIPTFCL